MQRGNVHAIVVVTAFLAGIISLVGHQDTACDPSWHSLLQPFER